MKTKVIVVGCLLMASGAAWSQMTPQTQQQLPPSDPSSSQYNSVYLPGHGVGDTVQSDSNERWEDRWGAIADDGSGTYGIVTDLASRTSAQEAAIAECKSRGGGRCKVKLAYYNQCAVVIAGRSGADVARAATEQEANRLGMDNCEKVEGKGACRVYYSGCSLPERTQ